MPALLTQEEIDSRLQQVQGWLQDGLIIQRKFRFSSFAEGMEFVNHVAQVSEEMDHHPGIAINYNRVTLSITTHSEGGLTRRDFRLAGKIDGLS